MQFLKKLLFGLTGLILNQKDDTYPCTRQIAIVLAKPQLDQKVIPLPALPQHPSSDELLDMREAWIRGGIDPKVSADWIIPDEGKKVLLLDLDKTLIFFSNSKGFFIRPHLEDLFKQIQSLYNIFIFTAANDQYALSIIRDLRSKGGSCIKGILSRKYCSYAEPEKGKGVFIKNISILKSCDPKNIVVVDDLPWSYCLNPQNALRVSPFTGDQGDRQLLTLAQELKTAHRYEDVREYIRPKYMAGGCEQTPQYD